jgi:SAM-dependent methyltransferase
MVNPKDIVREGYDKVSCAYRGDTFDPNEDPYSRQCLDLLLPHLARGSRVLDLGCGCGIPAAQDLSALHTVTGVDISQVQIDRARSLVPSAELICADMTDLTLPAEELDAIISLYAIIHVPLEEQHDLFRRMSIWLKHDGWLLCTVGHQEWTGTEDDWLGVQGGTMFWSHTDERTYRRWLTDLGFQVVENLFIPEGQGGHTTFLAQKIANKGIQKIDS